MFEHVPQNSAVSLHAFTSHVPKIHLRKLVVIIVFIYLKPVTFVGLGLIEIFFFFRFLALWRLAGVHLVMTYYLGMKQQQYCHHWAMISWIVYMKPIWKQIQNQSRMHQGTFQINCQARMRFWLFVVFVVAILVWRTEIVNLFFVIRYLQFLSLKVSDMLTLRLQILPLATKYD